eukprot:SAG31_NODE_1195_length_9445_cov_21.712711_5_plen_320_part_00
MMQERREEMAAEKKLRQERTRELQLRLEQERAASEQERLERKRAKRASRESSGRRKSKEINSDIRILDLTTAEEPLQGDNDLDLTDIAEERSPIKMRKSRKRRQELSDGEDGPGETINGEGSATNAKRSKVDSSAASAASPAPDPAVREWEILDELGDGVLQNLPLSFTIRTFAMHGTLTMHGQTLTMHGTLDSNPCVFALINGLKNDADVDEDELFMRKFLLSEVSRGINLGKEWRAADRAANRSSQPKSSKTSSRLGSAVAAPAKSSSDAAIRKGRGRRKQVPKSQDVPSTCARELTKDNYKSHVIGNIRGTCKSAV